MAGEEFGALQIYYRHRTLYCRTSKENLVPLPQAEYNKYSNNEICVTRTVSNRAPLSSSLRLIFRVLLLLHRVARRHVVVDGVEGVGPTSPT